MKNDSKRLLITNRAELRNITYGTTISFIYQQEKICGKLIDKSTIDYFSIAQTVTTKNNRSTNEKRTYKYHLVENLNIIE